MGNSVKSTTNRPPAAPDLLAQARALLGRAVGFGDCEPQALDDLVASGQLRVLGRGEYAVRRGDPSTAAWFLVQGLLEASLVRSDGQRQLLGLLLPGDLFSLMAVVDDGGAEYDVSAREPCVALLLPLASLRALRDRHPCLARACEAQFVHRARVMQRRLTVDPGISLDTRTAGMLKLLGGIYGTPTAHGVEFNVKLTQSDLADWMGLSRQRMNFALKQLEAEGLIRLQYLSITIVDPSRLAARAEG